MSSKLKEFNGLFLEKNKEDKKTIINWYDLLSFFKN